MDETKNQLNTYDTKNTTVKYLNQREIPLTTTYIRETSPTYVKRTYSPIRYYEERPLTITRIEETY